MHSLSKKLNELALSHLIVSVSHNVPFLQLASYAAMTLLPARILRSPSVLVSDFLRASRVDLALHTTQAFARKKYCNVAQERCATV